MTNLSPGGASANLSVDCNDTLFRIDAVSNSKRTKHIENAIIFTILVKVFILKLNITGSHIGTSGEFFNAFIAFILFDTAIDTQKYTVTVQQWGVRQIEQ